ncbi:MAG: heavy-metal-associated domain-containing protein [Chloroflexi bacterium]|nr:heavy-metal-associated domain-containing protein [Chloroflexota bacterium]
MMVTFTKAPLLHIVLLFLFLFIGGLATDRSSRAGEPGGLQTVTLKIDGMDCGACAKDIRSALLKVTGVNTAEIKVKKRWLFLNDFSNAQAIIEFNPGEANIGQLIRTVEGASNAIFTYKAKVVE